MKVILDAEPQYAGERRPSAVRWRARLRCVPLGLVWRCSHEHEDSADAEECAEVVARILARGLAQAIRKDSRPKGAERQRQLFTAA